MLNRTTIHAAVAVLAIFFSSAVCNRALAAFTNGDFITYSQEDYGTSGTDAAGVMLGNFPTVYPSNFFEVGIPGPTGRSIILTGGSFVLDLLPTFDVGGSLLTDETNLPTTSSGIFGGDVIALQLNVDFSDAGVLPGTAGVPFGDLVLTGFEVTDLQLPLLNGLTVRQFLANSNTLLGGGTGIYSINQILGLTDVLSDAFESGTPSQFAQDHLVVPEPSTFGLALLALLGLACRRRRA